MHVAVWRRRSDFVTLHCTDVDLACTSPFGVDVVAHVHYGIGKYDAQSCIYCLHVIYVIELLLFACYYILYRIHIKVIHVQLPKENIYTLLNVMLNVFFH